MAEKEASLIIKLKDLASTPMKGLIGGIGNLKSAYLGITAAISGVVAIGIASLKAYADQENAVNKLEQALLNQGLSVKQTSAEYQAYASELQRTTTFTDEAIIETQALLTTFGLSGDEMKRATVAALDLSKGLGIDLKSATMLIAKSTEGETTALSRYGIKIDETIPKSQKFEAVLGKLNERFGGQAQAALNTTAGKIENFSNRIGELKERIGAELIPVVNFWIGAMEKAIGFVERLTGASENDLSVREMTIQKMREEMQALIEKSTLEGTYHDETIQRRLANYQDALIREQGLLQVEQQNDAKRRQMTTSRQSFLKTQAEEERKRNETEAQKKDDLLTNLDLKIQKMNDDSRLQRIQWQEDELKRTEDYNKARTQNFESTLNFIASLSTAKNKQLAAIGKAAAISTATIDTFAAANKALASAPPPFNFGLAAAVVAAGMVNVAKISGVKLAEGGIVMPRQGGTQATIGEAGSPEAVIPLDDDRARGMLGGHTIVIQAGAFMGDRSAAKEFAKMIDKELFALERNGMSVRT